MCLAIVTTAAVAGYTRCGMVKGRYFEIAVTGAVTDQAIRPTRSRHWHMRC